MNPLDAHEWVKSQLIAHIGNQTLTATAGSWALHTAVDGAPLLACRVVGPDAEEAITTFVQDTMLTTSAVGDRRPALEYDVPGRIGCTWRSGGTWISLWTPDAPTVAQVPAGARRAAVDPVRRVLAGRLMSQWARLRTRPTQQKAMTG